MDSRGVSRPRTAPRVVGANARIRRAVVYPVRVGIKADSLATNAAASSATGGRRQSAVSAGVRLSWIRRRAEYGPTGMRPRRRQ